MKITYIDHARIGRIQNKVRKREKKVLMAIFVCGLFLFFSSESIQCVNTIQRAQVKEIKRKKMN